jgi:U11/U12 small nuclear ribonucleoprotein SNRNP65
MNEVSTNDLIYDKNDQYLLKNSNQFRRKLFEKLHGISSKFKIDYSINPNLKYEYPELNPIILENIINALIACPRFYIQTLHLMNKMNLPCPLVNYVRVARPSQFQNVDLNTNIFINNNISESKNSEEQVDNLAVDMSTSDDESEMESEENKKPIAKQQPAIIIESQPKKIKVKSFLNKSIDKTAKCLTEENLNDIFEKNNDDENNKSLKKQIPLNLKYDDLLDNRMILESEFEGFAKMAPLNANQTKDKNESTLILNQEADLFKDNHDFISQIELEKNRLKIAELKELAVYKNYEKGEPNSRLYIKNISKKVQESDLKYIYGRYINWKDETHLNSFDIRLMKEGIE